MRVRMAANHWRLAVDTHAANLPHADHDCADISQVDPRRYPSTDILWASPECTNHSLAKGRRRAGRQPDLFGETLPDEAAERSRATMWDVCRFAEVHRYRGIVVENVVDVRDWVMWPAWRHALDCLGYDHEVVYLNSMFAAALGDPAPQSRDRLYVVAWRRGDRRPDRDRWTRPAAWCPTCGQVVYAVQAWKRPGRRHGRYRAQYVYRCPHTTCRHAEVFPPVLPAAVAIDWTMPGERIADRARPLSAATMRRIEAGLRRYGVANPATSAPLATGAAGRALVMRNFTARGDQGQMLTPVGEPLRTLVASNVQSLVSWVYPYDTGMLRPVSGPLPIQTTVEGDAPETSAVQVEDCRLRMLEPHEIQAGMAFAPSYQVLGNRRERIRQLGNAVTPPAARDLVAALVEALTGEPVDCPA